MTTPLGPLASACQALAVDLTAAGVPATLTKSHLSVPGAWVRPDSLTGPVNLAGDMRARVSVILVAPVAGDLEALTDLEGLLSQVVPAVLTPDDDIDTTVVLPHNGNNLPAFRLVVDLDL